jgi:hypothetical protein
MDQDLLGPALTPDRGWLSREFADGRVLDLNLGYTLPRLTVSPTSRAVTYDATY